MESICIVEGFDMVGKSLYVSRFMSKYKQYTPNHDLTDMTVGRGKSWVIGYGIIDFLSQVHDDNNSNVVINRGICSSIVYGDIYENGEVGPETISYYKNSKFFHENVDILYFCHSSKNIAEIIYNKSQSRSVNPNEISAKYDKFKSFEDYWKTYCEFDEAFRRSFDLLNIKPYCIQTLLNKYEVYDPSGELVRTALLD